MNKIVIKYKRECDIEDILFYVVSAYREVKGAKLS